MGVERAVTLWYIQRQFLLDEIALLQAQLAQHAPAANIQDATAAESTSTIQQQLSKAQGTLRSLGPCPKPMMG